MSPSMSFGQHRRAQTRPRWVRRVRRGRALRAPTKCIVHDEAPCIWRAHECAMKVHVHTGRKRVQDASRVLQPPLSATRTNMSRNARHHCSAARVCRLRFSAKQLEMRAVPRAVLPQILVCEFSGARSGDVWERRLDRLAGARSPPHRPNPQTMCGGARSAASRLPRPKVESSRRAP